MALPLGAQELAVVDLLALRDGAVPDLVGRVLPPALERGSAVVGGSPDLIVGDPTYDVVAGTCVSCAPDPGPCSTMYAVSVWERISSIQWIPGDVYVADYSLCLPTHCSPLPAGTVVPFGSGNPGKLTKYRTRRWDFLWCDGLGMSSCNALQWIYAGLCP